MSWNVSANGTVAEVKARIDEQFIYPLATPPAGLASPAERDTVWAVYQMIQQVLMSYHPNATVTVVAYGHLSTTALGLEGVTQSVNITILPGTPS